MILISFHEAIYLIALFAFQKLLPVWRNLLRAKSTQNPMLDGVGYAPGGKAYGYHDVKSDR